MANVVISSVSPLPLARPGRGRNGLQALLRMVSEIERVRPASSESGVPALMSQQHPCLAMLASSSAEAEMTTYPAAKAVEGAEHG